MSVLHYAGSLRIHTRHKKGGSSLTVISGGWAACCSGTRAMKIRETGQHSYDREAVTCKACLKLMQKAGAAPQGGTTP